MKQYKCVDDLQNDGSWGDGFLVGTCLSVTGWRKLMLKYTENETIIKELKKRKREDLIKYISDTWLLKIEIIND